MGSPSRCEIELWLTVFTVQLTDAKEDMLFNPQGSEQVLEIAKEASIYHRESKNGHAPALSICKNPGSATRTVILCALHRG